MADECFGWAREAQTDEVRLCYVNLAETWLQAASWMEDCFRSLLAGSSDGSALREAQGSVTGRDTTPFLLAQASFMLLCLG
jgi:hypothetical protein